MFVVQCFLRNKLIKIDRSCSSFNISLHFLETGLRLNALVPLSHPPPDLVLPDEHEHLAALLHAEVDVLGVKVLDVHFDGEAAIPEKKERKKRNRLPKTSR